MEYLFFDIECANCFDNKGKICEFGYVLTDDNFVELDKDNLIINPNAPFDWYVLKKMLAYDKKEYLKSAVFPDVYEKIRGLFAREVLVFGHSVDGDARYLNDECKRYNLPFLNYKFYDVMHIYKGLTGSKDGLGLKKIAEELGTKEQEHEHRAVDDAETTMYVVKTLCNKLGAGVNKLIDSYEECKGETKNGKISTIFHVKVQKRREQKLHEKQLEKRNKKENIMQ